MGLRITIIVNTIIVLITVITLVSIIIFGLFLAHKTGNVQLTALPKHFADTPFFPSFLYATSIVFVAFTGYSRIATMAEDMKSPGTTIRFAIFFSILIVAFLYIGVALTGLSVLGPDKFSDFSENNVAPLFGIADKLSSEYLRLLVSIGAVTAMLGVMLNLILGVSRVFLAMGRNGDMPRFLATIKNSNPTYAIIFACLVVLGLMLAGDIKSNWSLSAFKVLIYYLITNLAALKLKAEDRFYPRWVSYLGLSGCLLLVVFFEHKTLFQGTYLILAGIIWFYVFLLINRFRVSR